MLKDHCLSECLSKMAETASHRFNKLLGRCGFPHTAKARNYSLEHAVQLADDLGDKMRRKRSN